LGRLLNGARLFGAVEVVWLGGGAQRWPVIIANHERDLADLTSRLEPDDFRQAWREGTRWTVQDAVHYALMPTSTELGNTLSPWPVLSDVCEPFGERRADGGCARSTQHLVARLLVANSRSWYSATTSADPGDEHVAGP
jgi:hypothetical protein